MTSMDRQRRFPGFLLLMALLVAACLGGPSRPSPDRMAADVARLDDIIPIVAELRVTDFEDSPYCQNLGYARGAFGSLEQDGCAREGTIDFDAVALADHARLAQAIETRTVPTSRIRDVSYAADDDVEAAWFTLDDASVVDDYAYLYDPAGAVPKVDQPGRLEFTQVAEDWWFVLSFDD